MYAIIPIDMHLDEKLSKVRIQISQYIMYDVHMYVCLNCKHVIKKWVHF